MFSLLVVLWIVYGYSLAFSGEGAWLGNLDKLFLKGVTVDTLSADELDDCVDVAGAHFEVLVCGELGGRLLRGVVVGHDHVDAEAMRLVHDLDGLAGAIQQQQLLAGQWPGVQIRGHLSRRASAEFDVNRP